MCAFAVAVDFRKMAVSSQQPWWSPCYSCYFWMLERESNKNKCLSKLLFEVRMRRKRIWLNERFSIKRKVVNNCTLAYNFYLTVEMNNKVINCHILFKYVFMPWLRFSWSNFEPFFPTFQPKFRPVQFYFNFLTTTE